MWDHGEANAHTDLGIGLDFFPPINFFPLIYYYLILFILLHITRRSVKICTLKIKIDIVIDMKTVKNHSMKETWFSLVMAWLLVGGLLA